MIGSGATFSSKLSASIATSRERAKPFHGMSIITLSIALASKNLRYSRVP